jgi:hypothetical protein
MIDSFDDLQYRTKRLANSDRLIMATVRPDEAARSQSQPENALARDLLARAMGYVDICARKNAEAVSSNPIMLYKPRGSRGRGRSVSKRTALYLSGKSGVARTKQNIMVAAEDDEFEQVEQHESLDILERPNPWVRSGTDYRFAQQYAKELTGNSYAAWVAGENALYTLNPGFVSILPDEDGDGLILGYAYGRDTSSPMLLEPDEVLHGTLYTDFRQPYYGVSWLNAIVDSADLWIATESYLRKTMQSSGRPDLLIHFEGQYSPEQFTQTKDTFYARIRQIMRGGKREAEKGNIVVTGEHEGKPTAIPLGHPPKDMASVDIANDAERTIGNAAGIPETVYRMSDSNLASARTGEMVWKRDTIMPRCIREAEEMTEWLHANWPEAKDGKWFFAPENCVPQDREADERIALGGWQSGLVRRNEARVVLGYDPIEGATGEAFAEAMQAAGPSPDPFASLFAPRQPREQEPVAQPVSAIGGDAENLSEGEKLNGAQITGALAILERVTLGTLAPGAATELLVALGIDRNRASAMVTENKRDAKPVEELDKSPSLAKSHDPGDETDHDRKKPKPCGCGTKSGPWLASKAWKNALAVDEAPDLGEQVEESESAALKLVAAYQAAFEQMRDDIIALTEAAPMGLKGANPRRYRTKDAINDILRAWGINAPAKWAEKLFEDTRPLIEDEFFVIAGDQIQAIRSSVSGAVADAIPTGEPRTIILQNDRAARAAEKFVERYQRDMDQVIATIAEDLAGTISEGLEGGESLREIQDRILNQYNAESEGITGTMSERRAATVARTEVARASTDGRIAGMAGSNVVRGYEFVKAAAACPICDAVETETRGKVFGIDEAIFPKGSSIVTTDGRQFKFDYDDTIVPIHPNCRCGVQPVLVDL